MKLTLKSEHLTALTTGELAEIIGGHQYTVGALTCPLLRCEVPSDRLTCRGCQIPPESVVC